MSTATHVDSTTANTSGTNAVTADSVRDSVRRAYSAAIGQAESKTEAGCCGPSCCGPDTATSLPTGQAAQSAGYGNELTQVPREAAQSSFGCGNPLAFAGVEAGETVVDLGSGAGLDLLIAAQKVGPEGKVIGIDMTDAMLEAARRNIERAGASQVEVRKGMIEALPIEDASVDWVISNCVINLSPEKSKVFAEIHRVLRPGGRFSISDIVAEDLPAAVREHAAAHAACIAGALSEDEYRSGLEAVGLTDVEVSERQVYDGPQLRAIVQSDLADLGLDDASLLDAAEAAAGKVWSAKLVGRKPGAA